MSAVRWRRRVDAGRSEEVRALQIASMLPAPVSRLLDSALPCGQHTGRARLVTTAHAHVRRGRVARTRT